MTLLEMFNKATEEDLEEVRTQIADLRAQMDSLTEVEKVLAKKFEPKAPRAYVRKPKASVDEKTNKVLDYLFVNGSKSTQKISESTGIAKMGNGCLSHIVADRTLFHVNPDGIVALTEEGQKRARLAAGAKVRGAAM